jgi:hypothetical protein
MKNEIQEKLALFASNAQAVRKEFTWHDTLVKKLAALIYSLEGRPVDVAAIKNCHAGIKNNTDIFSSFRGNMALCISAMLSLKENPAELFGNTLRVYKMLKSAKFWASDYLVVAAYEIASQAKPEEYGQVITRTKEFYDRMKSKGFFRTGQDDYIFSAMLGLSDTDVKTGAERIEQLYQRFKPAFWSGNSVQALAQVLVLSGECETAIDRILKLRDAMKSQKIRLDRAYTLPSLGVLALLPVDIDTLVRDINAAQAFLATQKGFSVWSVSKQALLLFSSAIVAAVYANDIENGAMTASVSTSIASIIIAQQAAIMASISAGTAASAAAASK